jgi:hypothetical protein
MRRPTKEEMEANAASAHRWLVDRGHIPPGPRPEIKPIVLFGRQVDTNWEDLLISMLIPLLLVLITVGAILLKGKFWLLPVLFFLIFLVVLIGWCRSPRAPK